MIDSLAAYKSVTRDLKGSLERTAKDPFVARETKYFLDTIGKIKSSKEFVANPRLLTYAATAFGLGDVAGSKALIKKLLDEGIDSPSALANRLSDSRYRAFAEAFNFNRYGSATTAFDRAQQGTADAYIRQTLEVRQGESNNSVRLALYFTRKAPELTSTLGILADKAVFEVVRTALGLPISIVNGDLEKQVASIEKKIKVQDFKDPAKLDKFLKRFFAMSEISGGGQVASASGVSIGSSLLAQIQTFRLGGR